jgi:hypothetical protein
MLSRVARRKVQAELDVIAEELETQGHAELADQVDVINDALMQGDITPEIAGDELDHIADKAELEELREARGKKKDEEEMKKEKEEKKEKKKSYDLSPLSDEDLQKEMDLRALRRTRESESAPSDYRSRLMAKMKSR